MMLGLDRVAAVAGRLDLPVPGVPVITVAGTNGKGSVVRLLEKLAASSGLCTGVYTSPHLLRFNERIVVDGAPVRDTVLCAAFERVEAARENTLLTYFEFSTLAALLVLFSQPGIDLVLLEVGLGGRLDAVNIVDADVAVITSIGLDHTEWLGEDREAIGREKARICRPARPLVCGDVQPPCSIAEVATQSEAPLFLQAQDFGIDANSIYWRDRGGALQSAPCPSEVWLGSDNLATAVQAFALTGRIPAERVIAEAARAELIGRCQIIERKGISWWLDVGHNIAALERFAHRVSQVTAPTRAVVAMLADKPAEALLPFVPLVEHWHLASLDGSRAGSAARLAGVLPDSVSKSLHDSVADAIAAAGECAESGMRVLVFGSFRTVAVAAKQLACGDRGTP